MARSVPAHRSKPATNPAAEARKPDPRGDNQDLIIDWMMENPEEPQWAAILGSIKQGATFEQLLQFDPEIATIPTLHAWFSTLYNGLHEEIFNPVDTRRPGRNPDHPTSDESGSTEGSGGPGDSKPS